MRYSQVNNWYKVQEALSGLDGTSEAQVQTELLRHLSKHHIIGFELDKEQLTVNRSEEDALRWQFRSEDSAKRFILVIREWFKSQHAPIAADASS